MTGAITYWLLNNSTVIATGVLPSFGDVSNWKVVGTPDLNRDGKADVLLQSASAPPRAKTPFGFVGKAGYYSDEESGLQLLGHRYYLPRLGRFLTQDPTGQVPDLNLYRYAHNNPLSFTDASGGSEDPAPGKSHSIRFSLAAFINQQTVVAPFPPSTTFIGDGRSFSPNSSRYRIEVQAVVDLKGRTVSFSKSTGQTAGVILGIMNYEGQASPNDLHGTLGRSINSAAYSINLYGEASDPFYQGFAPPVRFNFHIDIDKSGNIIDVTGFHTNYPSFELYSYTGKSTSHLLYGYDADKAGAGVLDVLTTRRFER